MSLIKCEKDGVVYFTAPNIRTRHAFTTRLGGVSRGACASLNLGWHRGDSEDAVRENYRRLAAALGVPCRFVFSRQVHGTVIRAATEADLRAPYEPTGYDADGLVTDVPGLPLFVFTADCIPILLHDPVRGAVGAVHAGWRGTAAGIAGIAVKKMAAEYGCRPENIRAAIGPGIGQCCFETDGDVPDALRRTLGADAEAFIAPSGAPGKSRVDLPGANARFLVLAGVKPENIERSGICTMCSHELFWSHRWTGGKRGSQGSVIVLDAER